MAIVPFEPDHIQLYFSCVFSQFHVSFILIIFILQCSPETDSDHVMSRPRRDVQPRKYVMEISDDEEEDIKEENKSDVGSEELSAFEESDVSCHTL